MKRLLSVLLLASTPAVAQQPPLVLTRLSVAVPSAERELPTVTATHWVKVLDAATPVEGLAFDTHGNLLFCDVAGDRVMRVTPDGHVSELFTRVGLSPSGIAVADDGRMIVAAGDKAGGVDAARDSGADWRAVVPVSAGYLPNDVALDGRGGFYFTDFKGTFGDLSGSVLHVAKDGTTTPVLAGLVLPNGIAFDPERKALWITEFGQNRLLRVLLETPTKPQPLRISPVYTFIGPAPDGARVDRQGRAYVALNGQGRVLVFSDTGLPIAQVLLPGRDEGRNVNSTSLALGPDGRELFVIASDGERGGGASIFRARLAP